MYLYKLAFHLSEEQWTNNDANNNKLILMFTVRLVGGSSSREGRLEILYYGEWGGVCYESTYSGTRQMNNAAARVVCSMLGVGYS